MKKTVNLAVIGCGRRSWSVVNNFLSAGAGRVKVVAVFDPDPSACELAKEKWQQDFALCSSMVEAVNYPGADTVGIFSPNAFHCEAIIEALQAGKQVFSEKPLATNIEDCRKIMDMEERTGIAITTGFVLRYAPIYRKVKELLDTGTFGKIINIAASENRHSWGGGASMSADYGWRRFRDKGGPYLLEKCSHDLDLLNWFIGGVPLRVAAFSSLDYFVPENAGLWEKFPRETYARLVPEGNRINPFTSPKDIYDNHTVIMDYPGGVKVSFQLTLANAIAERRMYISCTEGNIIVECFSGIVRYRRYGDEYETTLHFQGDGHGGGDKVMAREVVDSLLDAGKGGCTVSRHGLDCAIVALAADESVRTGKVVELP